MRLLKRISIKRVLALQPCRYDTEAKLLALSGGRRWLTPPEICDLAAVSPTDRVWILASLPVLSPCDLRLFACDCAWHVLRYFESKYSQDRRVRKCIQTARRFARGAATLEQLDAAVDSARAAVDSARAAARDSAWAAVGATAWHAGCAAVAAAWHAGAARAARAAESDWQLRRLRRYLVRASSCIGEAARAGKEAPDA